MIPGETATASVSATIDGRRTPVSVEQVEFGRGDRTALSPIPTFRDDGVAQDAIGSDQRWTAGIRPDATALATFRGDLKVIVSVRAGAEAGIVSFSFVYTGAPPAAFTESVRDAVEDGSLALYAGIVVEQPGRYGFLARLYDARDRPVAVMQFNDLLTATDREIRFLAFGKLLRDENAISPFTLRDIEGWRMIEQGTPDRQMLHMWLGPYTTSAYPSDAFSDREWDSDDKQKRLRALERVGQRR